MSQSFPSGRPHENDDYCLLPLLYTADIMFQCECKSAVGTRYVIILLRYQVYYASYLLVILAYYYHYYGQLVPTPTHSSHERHCKNNNNNYTAMSVRRSESVYEISEQDYRLYYIHGKKLLLIATQQPTRFLSKNLIYIYYIPTTRTIGIYIRVSEQYHVPTLKRNRKL